MSRVSSKNTKPEVTVRRLLHALGYRFRLHGRALPGKPDIVFTKKRRVVFIHGCFWHGHAGCQYGRLPKSRIDFWRAKIDNNRSRDKRVQKELAESGWAHVVVWQCELKDRDSLVEKLVTFLGDPKSEVRKPKGVCSEN